MAKPVLLNYTYRSPPAGGSQTDRDLYTAGELRSAAQAINSLVAVVGSQGKTLASATLGATGVKAGSYTNPTVTVALDGRITQIANGDSPFPKGGLSGQYLVADGNGGVAWRYGSSSGGGGSSSTTVIQGAKPVESADLAVANPSPSTFALSLKPTGVVAGSYTNPVLTVDANGRLTAVQSGPDLQAQVAALQAQVAELQARDPDVKFSPDGSRWFGSISNDGVYSFVLTTYQDAITAEDGFTMIGTEDGSDYLGF